MRVLMELPKRCDTYDTGMTPNPVLVSYGFLFINIGLVGCMTRMTPKTNFLGESINYTEYRPVKRSICLRLRTVIRVIHRAKRLFLNTFWYDTQPPLVSYGLPPSVIPTRKPLKSLTIHSKRRCIRHASR